MVQGIRKRKFFAVLLMVQAAFLLSSCSRLLGYGVLLWSSEDPPVPSGTVLPVYIRSNIDKVWVVGIPREFQSEDSRVNKFEIPLPKLELAGSRTKALAQAEAFAPFARTYAETLQDGLPIREQPDNGARRVYRLKQGEMIKILSKTAAGTTAVGATGDPLPGDWYRVLTEDGVSGYCFSYRLSFFEHTAGPLTANRDGEGEAVDPELERLLDLTWSPESYGIMVSSQKIDLEELSQKWFFDPGQETGIAAIKTSDLNIAFPYTKIRSTGTQSWRFEGTGLQMNLRSENTLAVQFTETNGILRTTLFVALPATVDDIILQETARRQEQFRGIYEQGPVFFSNSYGTLTFTEEGRFTWTGNTLLVPQLIPAQAIGSGTAEMRLFMADSLADRYNGAFTLRFDGIGGVSPRVDFLYSFDSQGFRIEYAPQTSMDGNTVMRRASNPTSIYFFRAENPDEMPLMEYSPPPLNLFPPPGEPETPARDWGGVPDAQPEIPSAGLPGVPPGAPPDTPPGGASGGSPAFPPDASPDFPPDVPQYTPPGTDIPPDTPRDPGPGLPNID